jgi:hypothetical protein
MPETDDHHLTFWRHFSASQSTPHASNIAKGKRKHVSDVVCSDLYQAVRNAEHTEANLLRAMRQPGCKPGANDQTMFPIAKVDQRQERLVHEVALHIVLRRWAEFDVVWEAANRVCDAYEIGKSKIENQTGNTARL